MFRKILVPLDGTELAEGILPFVSQLAKSPDVSIVLLSVIDPGDAEVPVRATNDQADNESSPPQIVESAEGNAIMHLTEVTQRLGKEGIGATHAVAVGRPDEEIVKFAEQEGCDLIAMSTRGRNPLGRGILGSVTDHVIHSSQLPTLTITPERAQTYWDQGVNISRLMVPLDGSALAETALPFAEGLARDLSLEIVLIRVVKVGGIYSAYIEGYPYAGMADVEREVENEATEYLTGIAGTLKAKGYKVSWKVHRGAPAAVIVDLAKETPQDIIVLASHGRSGLTRWVIGSVAEAVVRASGDPVLVVPPPRE